MFILTAKVPRRKLALCAATAAFLCCCVLVTLLIPPGAQHTAASALPDPKGIKGNEERIAYLEHYGWQVSPQPIATEELQIPKTFDESYTEYLSLQSVQGFTLENFAGKRVKRYTYEILNYPTGETGVVANLLLYKNTVVGGEVLSPRLDGFLHGLSMPQKNGEA